MSTINAITSPAPAIVTTVDSTGNLILQTAGTNAVTYDANQNATHTGYISAPNTFGFKNRLINGHMMIDQRNAGGSVSATNGGYTLDRWATFSFVAGAVTGKFTVQQNAGSVTPPAGFSNYLGVTSSASTSVASGNIFGIYQWIEGNNIADLGWGTANAKTITISAWVYSSLTGTFGGCLQNNASNRTYPFTYTISSANTWTQISVTIPGCLDGTWVTNNGAGIGVIFGLGIGSTYSGTAGSWATSSYYGATGATSVISTNGATFYITGVQLEVGSKSTPFDMRDFTTELLMCQRYFCKSFNYSVVPAASASVGFFSTITAYSSSNVYMSNVYNYPVQMRASPTVTFYTVTASPGSTGTVDYYAGGWTAFTSTAVQAGSQNHLSIYGSSAAAPFTTWYSYLCSGNFTATAEL